MKGIPLTQNKIAIVDDEDYERLKNYNWHFTHYGYAARKVPNGGILMHREILRVTDNKIYIDHINKDKLDNRRCNLRICPPSENSHNSDKSLGAYLDKDTGLWRSRIRINGEIIQIGYFGSLEEARNKYLKLKEDASGLSAKSDSLSDILIEDTLPKLLDTLGRRNRKYSDKVCPVCTKVFTPKNGKRDTFCSKSCAYKGRRKK